MFYAQASSEQARTYILLKEKHLTMNGFIMILVMKTSLAMRHIINIFRQAQTFISVQFNQKNRCGNKNDLHERLPNGPLKACSSIYCKEFRVGAGLRMQPYLPAPHH